MTEFHLTRQAELDMLEIARFTLEHWGPVQMDAYVRDLDQRFSFLAKHQDAGRTCDYVRRHHRKFPQGSHVI